MAKGSMGGQRAGGSLSGAGSMQQQINQSQQTQQTQVDDTQQASAFSTDYNTFMAMSDDEKADFISAAVKQGVPDHLAQNDFQKFVYNSGLTDKPDVVDDATLNTMNGTEMFRTVNNVYDSKNDLSYNADQIAKQVMAGRVTRVSDNGGSAHGRGIYFADNYSNSVNTYGNTRGNVKSTAVMRAKLNNNARVLNESTGLAGVRREIASGSKLGKVLSKCDKESRISIYGMAKGYNVIKDDVWHTGYLVVLNRNAMTMSSSIKAKSSSW